MNIGFVGLGKLGLPVAQTIAAQGHTVVGWDVNGTSLGGATCIADTVADADIVFVAVQTPHAPAYDGSTRLPDDRRDFEYAYLVDAVRAVAKAARDAQQWETTIAVISTVLPGTCDRLLRSLLTDGQHLAYNPSFIAMGTVEQDFLDPEFVLIGTDGADKSNALETLYRSLHRAPIVHTSVASAELAKVAYNTFVGLKVAFANTVMELAHHTGADCDEVTDALGHATQRLLSPRYLRGGMGDGGPCHPRDNIALSWLARRVGLSYDLFGALMEAREAHTGFLASVAASWADLSGLAVCVLGTAYKAESELLAGSPAVLLATVLRDRGIVVKVRDPVVCPGAVLPNDAHVFVVAANHAQFAGYKYPEGSVVIDPWGDTEDQDGVTVVRIGRKS